MPERCNCILQELVPSNGGSSSGSSVSAYTNGSSLSSDSDSLAGNDSSSSGSESSGRPLSDSPAEVAALEQLQGQPADRVSGQDAIDRYLTLYPDD